MSTWNSRRAPRIVARTLLTLIGTLALAVLLLQHDGIATGALRRVANWLQPWPDARLEIGRASISGISRVSVADLRLVRADSTAMVEVDSVRLRLSLLPLLTRRLHLGEVRVVNATIVARELGPSGWDLTAPFQTPDTTPQETASDPFEIAIERLDVIGSRLEARYLGDSTLRVDSLILAMRDFRSGDGLPVLSLDTLGAQLTPPGRPTPATVSAKLYLGSDRLSVSGLSVRSDSTDLSAAGDLRLPDADPRRADAVDFRLAAAPLDFRDIGALVPGFDVPGSLRLDLRVTGTANLLTLTGSGRSFDGATLTVDGALTPRTTGGVRYRSTLRVDGLDASLWSNDAAAGSINAQLSFDLSGDSLTVVSGPFELDADGVVVGEGRLVPTRLSGAFEQGRGRLKVQSGWAPWVDLRGKGEVRPFDEQPSYQLDVTLTPRDSLLQAGTVALDNLQARIEVAGTGAPTLSGQGRATLTATGTVAGQPLENTSLRAEWREQRVDARLGATLGSARAAGTLLLERRGQNDALSFRVPRLTVSDLALAPFLGDSARGCLHLDANAQGARLEPAAITADGTLRWDSAGWGSLAVDSAAASFRLADGRVRLTGGARSAGGTVSLDGQAQPFLNQPIWDLTELRIRDIDLAAIDAAWPASQISATASLSARGNLPALTGDGAVRIEPSRVDSVRFGPSDLALTLAPDRVTMAGTLPMAEGAVEIAAAVGPFGPVPGLDARLGIRQLALGPLTQGRVQASVSGPITLTLTPTPGDTTSGLMRLVAALKSAAGTASLDGHAALTRRSETGDSAAWQVTRGEADLALHLTDLGAISAQDSINGQFAATARIEGQGVDPATMRWTGRAHASGNANDARLDSLALRGAVSNGVFRLDTLLLASNILRGGGSGRVPLVRQSGAGDTLRVHLVADTTRPPPAQTVLPIRPLGIRSGQIDARVWRNDQGLALAGSASVGGLIAGMAAADTLQLDLTRAESDGTDWHVNGQATGKEVAWQTTHLQQVDAKVSSEAGEMTFSVSARRDAGHQLTLGGRGRASERRFFLSDLGFTFGETVWALSDTASISWGDRIVVSDLELRAGRRRIEVDGHLDRTGTQALALTLDSVPIGGFAAFAGLENLNGTLHGTVHLEGPADQVAVRTNLNLAMPDVVARLTTSAPSPGQLRLDARLQDRQGRTLEAAGTIPFRLTLAGDSLLPTPPESAPVDLTLRGTDFPIGWMAPFAQFAGVERIEGQVSSDARLTGTIGSPSASGTIRLAGGRITVPRQGVDYRRITADATFAGETIQVTRLEATADGTASVRGNIVLTTLNDPELALDANFKEFRALRNEWVRLGLDGNIRLTGTVSQPKAEGSISLVKTDIYADEVGQGTAAMPVELTPADYAMLESYFGYRPGDAAIVRDPLLPWAIDVKLTLGGDVWLRKQAQPQMRVLLTGSLDVRKAANDSLQLFGTAEVVPGRSVVEQFGRRFAIDQGSVTFNGLVTDWTTSIEASYAVPSTPDAIDPNIQITLSVTGKMDSLRLELSSNPQLETSDLVSYLATGRPAARALSGSGESTSLTDRGTSLALGTVTGLLERQAGEAVGLDVMEIRHGGPDGTVVIAGRYVSPRLYVGFQQPLNSAQSDQSLTDKGPTTRVEVEYTLFRWLLLNLQAGQSEFRSFFRTRYAF